MSEQMEKMVGLLEQNLRIIAFAVALALLGGVYYVSNSTSSVPVVAEVLPPDDSMGDPAGGGAVEGDAIADIRSKIRKDQQITPIERSEFRTVVAMSMFDHSGVAAGKQLAVEAARIAKQAQNYYTQARYTEAVQYCKQALAKNLNDPTAVALKKRLESDSRWR